MKTETPAEHAARVQAILDDPPWAETHYRHWSQRLLYTEGVRAMAETAGVHWLIDLIASWQPRALKDIMLQDFQLWTLKVHWRDTPPEGWNLFIGREKAPAMATAACFRDTDDEAFHQHIPYTDFPLGEIKLYVENQTLLLPSER